MGTINKVLRILGVIIGSAGFLWFSILGFYPICAGNLIEWIRTHPSELYNLWWLSFNLILIGLSLPFLLLVQKCIAPTVQFFKFLMICLLGMFILINISQITGINRYIQIRWDYHNTNGARGYSFEQFLNHII